MPTDGLTDSLPRNDPKSQNLAYNNTTDRMRIELPPMGDMAASGVVSVISSYGTSSLPVYITSAATDQLYSRRFTYNALGDIDTIKEATVATPSGSPCKLLSFTYLASGDIDYILESLGTW